MQWNKHYECCKTGHLILCQCPQYAFTLGSVFHDNLREFTTKNSNTCESPLILAAQVKNNSDNKITLGFPRHKLDNEGDKTTFREMPGCRETWHFLYYFGTFLWVLIGNQMQTVNCDYWKILNKIWYWSSKMFLTTIAFLELQS